MTGAYLRAKRNGKWQPVEVEYLTDDERKEKFLSRDATEIIDWLNIVCRALVKAEKVLDALAADGIVEKVVE